MKELLMSNPNGGGESNIIRADITVGYFNNEEATPPTHGYGYANLDTITTFPKFGQCSNSKITALCSGESSADTSTMLLLTTPMVASNVTITRLDTGYSISYPDADTTKNVVIIDGSLFFTQQDLDKTIPIEIRFA